MTLIDLSHVIEHDMITYAGLPGAHICDFWDRQASAANYDDGSSFQIGRIDMVANTGTYIDSPFHRYADGDDLAALDLARLASLPAILIRTDLPPGAAVDVDRLDGIEVKGKAVLFHTGWNRHWRTHAYSIDHPFLSQGTARRLVEGGAALVGIDSYNIDDTRTRSRPVHSLLLGSGIPICEHLTNLGALPTNDFSFTAVPPKVAGMGSFPVRAFARTG